MAARRKMPEEIYDVLYKAQKGKCMYCGARLQLTNRANVDIDHKTPVARNGSDKIGNLQLTCKPCNKLKGPYKDDEFRRIYHLGKSKNPPTKRVSPTHFKKVHDELKYIQKVRRLIQSAIDRRRQYDDDDYYDDEW